MSSIGDSQDLNKLKRIEEIKVKAQEVIENRKNANNLIDLLDIIKKDLTSEDKSSQLMIETVIRSLNKIFIRFIHTKELTIASDESAANRTYKKWLTDVYNQNNSCLMSLIGNDRYSKSTQKLALNSLMKCVGEEGKYPFIEINDEYKDTFADSLLNDICKALLSTESDNRNLIGNYVENYLSFDDCIHYTLKAIELVLNDTSDQELSEENEDIFVRNVYQLLTGIRLTLPEELQSRQKKLKRKAAKSRQKGGTKGRQHLILCVPTQPNQKCFKLDYERDADLLASVWTQFLRHQLPKDLYKSVLVLLDKQLIQHFRNPLVLTDFLIDSYDIGGVVSLLSLSSLYVLIQKCNLNYPKFYEKLYRLLKPSVLQTKYRARFLFWTDVFLSSTHISAQIVASFAKRLARIALTSSTDALLILIPIIGNLLIRHPTLSSMIRNTQTNDDAFDENCEDPENTNAINSCLWELKTLQNHFHPEVAKKAHFIDSRLPDREWDLSDLLETTIDDVVEASFKKLCHEKQLTYDDKYSSQLMSYFCRS